MPGRKLTVPWHGCSARISHPRERQRGVAHCWEKLGAEIKREEPSTDKDAVITEAEVDPLILDWLRLTF